MPLRIRAFDGGTTRASFASILGLSQKRFRQLSLYADPDNAGSIFIGGSTVTSGGVNRHLKVKAGISVNLGPKSSEEPFTVDTEAMYAVGANAADVLYIIALLEDRR